MSPWVVSVRDSLAVGVRLLAAAHSQGCQRCQGPGCHSGLPGRPPHGVVGTKLGQPFPGPAACGHPTGGALRSEREVALGGASSRLHPASLGRLQVASCCGVPFAREGTGTDLPTQPLHLSVCAQVPGCHPARTPRVGMLVQGSGRRGLASVDTSFRSQVPSDSRPAPTAAALSLFTVSVLYTWVMISIKFRVCF